MRKAIGTTVRRVAGHLLILAIIAGAIAVARPPAAETLRRLSSLLPEPSGPVPGRANGFAAPARGGPQPDPSGDLIARVANPITTIPLRPRRSIITYTVQSGDTPISIAQQFGIDPRTVLWGNPDLGTNPELLQIGQVLNILPVDGVLHRVVDGDTVESVAAAYHVEPAVITGYVENQIPKSGQLQVGSQIIVPGGQRELVVWSVPQPPAPSVYAPAPGVSPGKYYMGAVVGQGTGHYIWPISGIITQSYWWGHRAVDISAVIGTPIAASDGGTVIFAGWSTAGYGNLVVIDHGNGAQTYYGHQSQIAVTLGQVVTQGQIIGYVGSTGHSTGPHLHFEIRYGGVPLNPLDYLP